VSDKLDWMDLYGQEAEVRLLSKLMAHLDRRTMIDVGAERGSLAQEMLRAGVEDLYAFEPHPDNARALRARFDDDRRIMVHEYAVSDLDGDGQLHMSADSDGRPLTFGHTLTEPVDTDEIAWRQTVTVPKRSLTSLMETGDIPESVGILKIDTEGHDLAVVLGMGQLKADVVMVEHWTNLPHGLGVCPWTPQEMVATLNDRGFTHFAFIVHRGEFVTIKWDDAEIESGAMGNLLFVRDEQLERLLPEILDCAGWLAEQAVRVGQRYMQAAGDRLTLVEELKETAETRLQALEATTTRMNSLNDELETLRPHPDDDYNRVKE
jgi:FkbM family methyltransferase